MDKASHHLQELKLAEIHAARGRELIAQQQKIAHQLRTAGGSVTTNANTFLKVLVETQELFDSHVDLLKRELARDTEIASGRGLCG